MIAALAILIALVSNVLGAMFSKRFADAGQTADALAACGLYALGTAQWCILVRSWQRGIAVVGLGWDVFSVLIVVGVGVWYGERLTVTQVAGVVVSMFGVWLVAK